MRRCPHLHPSTLSPLLPGVHIPEMVGGEDTLPLFLLRCALSWTPLQSGTSLVVGHVMSHLAASLIGCLVCGAHDVSHAGVEGEGGGEEVLRS